MQASRQLANRAAIVLLLTVLLLVPQLPRGGLSGYDDALYAHEAREMVEHGDWWNIHFNGALNFEYPPLFIWIEAVSLRVFGVSDFAAKLPAALAGIATVGSIYFLAAELTGDAWLGVLSMLVLTTTQPFLKYSSHAMTDVPFTLFFTLALLSYLKGLRMPWYFLAAGLAIAAAILTRSVIGLLPIVIIALHVIVTRRWRILRSAQVWAGLLVALAVPLIWMGSQYQLHGREYLDQHLAFVLGKVKSSGTAPSLHVWPYAKELLKYYWPWLPVAIFGLVTSFRERTRGTALVWLWLAMAIIPFTLVETTYGRYLMPAYVALAVLCGMVLDRWIVPARREMFFRIVCAVIAGVIVYTLVAPPFERGGDMRTLAKTVDANSQPGQRVLLYANGEPRFDLQNQLLWYGGRYTRLVTDSTQLREMLNTGTIGVIDKVSFETIKPNAGTLDVLAESERFVCFRATPR